MQLCDMDIMMNIYKHLQPKDLCSFEAARRGTRSSANSFLQKLHIYRPELFTPKMRHVYKILANSIINVGLAKKLLDGVPVVLHTTYRGDIITNQGLYVGEHAPVGNRAILPKEIDADIHNVVTNLRAGVRACIYQDKVAFTFRIPFYNHTFAVRVRKVAMPLGTSYIYCVTAIILTNDGSVQVLKRETFRHTAPEEVATNATDIAAVPARIFSYLK